MANQDFYTLFKKAMYEGEDLKADTIEDAYEQLYRRVTRIQDMDDFSIEILQSVKSLLDKGVSYENAFKQVLDSQYEFADYNYFADVLTNQKENLLQLLDKVLKSDSPEEAEKLWNTEINWIADHYVINYNGTDYTLEELQSKIEKGADY